MAVKAYLIVYVILVVATLIEVAIVNMQLATALTIVSIVGLAGLKAVLIAMFYQHLKDEPTPISGIMMFGLIGVVLFIVLSLLSIRIFLA